MTKTKAPGPPVAPHPGLALAEVPDLPPEAAEICARRGVRTLADLRPLVEAEAAGDPQCEPVFVLTAKWELPLFVRYKTGSALIALLGGRAHMLKVMAAWPKPAASAAPDDFDETTPPPRVRPQGAPVPREVRLVAGEDVVETFRTWDREGRVPAGCVLCELIGIAPFGEGTDSGHRLLAVCPPAAVMCPPGVGREARAKDLERFRVRVSIRLGGSAKWYAVLAPREGRR